MPEQHTATIRELRSLTNDVKHFVLHPKGKIDFKAGQFIITVLKDQNGKEVRRSYSVANAPNDNNTLELCVKLLPDGAGSQIFDRFTVGDKIVFEGPIGKFVVEDDNDHIFIAAGVGIAPIRGQIQQLVKEKFSGNVLLYYSFRKESDFYYKEELQNLPSNFKMLHSVTQPGPNYEGESGRVTDLVKKHLQDNNNQTAFVCGPPLMIKDIVPLLREKGFERKDIKLDIWEA